jgi:hypothetical protein
MNRYIFLLATLLICSAPVLATSFISRPLPETTQRTPTIVRGKVGSSHADWAKTPESGKRLYTFYELQISEVFKGDPKPGSTILFRQLGGEKDGIGLQIAGSAQFSPGEDVVLTLGEKNPDGSYDLRGLMTGKFGIGRDQSGNEILIGATGDDVENAPADHHGPWTLGEFRKLVASQSPTSHIEASPTPNVKADPAPAPSNLSSMPVASSTQAASPLQVERDQGAAQPADTGAHRGAAVIVILLLGGLWVGWMMRKKK